MPSATYGLPLAAALLAVAAGSVGAREAEDFLTERWYRLELILFERGPADATVRRLHEATAYPQGIIAMTNARPEGGTVAFAPELQVDNEYAAFFADMPPPLWLVGDCVAPHWAPPHGWSDQVGPLPHDPCRPRPPEPLLGLADGPGEPGSAADTLGEPLEAPTRQLAMDAVTEAFAGYERSLLGSSYEWQPGVQVLGTAAARLRRRFNVVAAGAWHQPLPARDAPQPLLIQVGEAEVGGRFDVEGWIAVTVQRFVHFRVHLTVGIDPDALALVSESRRLRSGEVHYLDHPVLGIIVHAEPVAIPQQLREQAEQLDAPAR